jgi:hypothetical protein
MPPYLAIPHYHLSKLPVTTKVALTCFSAALVAAILFVTLGVFMERTGFSPRRVKANFAGDERVTRETGDRFPAEEMYSEPSRRALYDVVHPHSFMMPLLYFVLCHMMEMSYGPRKVKLALYLVAFASMMVVTFAPLLVAWSIGLAPVVIVSVVAMSLTFGAMTVVPPWQMWFPGTRGEGRA